ncbi:cell division control protein 45-like protein [Hibiscus syriacus]|uniref:Cell division control protein 45-like protein n=1 Tax=Hibiscus syriacus TaxID=106335 RepID=A0A6A2X7D8_HIBSY|nr:cell division control protein 45-like protein [Hibiscus syriacus]
MSTLEARGPSLRRYRQRKAVLDLNVPPSEIREHEGTSQQAGSEELIDRPAPPATIDVETIDDDVIESSAIAFAEAKTNSRRSRGRTVVDVDSAGIQIAERNCNSGRYFTVAPPSKTDIREKHGV